jgi:steroid delta-isomerase-like uncharacterized protein
VFLFALVNHFTKGKCEGESAMTETENTAIARRWFDEIWNKRREATIHELLDPNAVGHLEGLVTHGVDEFLAARAFILNAFPDVAISVEATAAQGDEVAVRWSVRGTHRGELLGVPATGRPITIRGMTWLRFTGDGRIAEGWDAWNQGRLMAELQAAASDAASPRA